MADYKALCARLCGAIALADGKDKALDDAYTEAIAALAAEPQQGVSDEDVLDDALNFYDYAYRESAGMPHTGFGPARGTEHHHAGLRAVLAHHTPTPAPVAVAAEPDVDCILNLAAIIREVDGNHTKGAAALAEAILSHPGIATALPLPEAQP